MKLEPFWQGFFKVHDGELTRADKIKIWVIVALHVIICLTIIYVFAVKPIYDFCIVHLK